MSLLSFPDFCAQLKAAHRSTEQQTLRNTSPQETAACLYREHVKIMLLTFPAAGGQMLCFLFPIILFDVPNPFRSFLLKVSQKFQSRMK